MNQHAPRTIAVIGSIALIAAAFAAGYQRARPTELSAPAAGSEVASAVRAALENPDQLEGAAGLAPILASLDEENLAAVVGAYESTFIAVGPSEVAMELLAASWSEVDPAGALERMEGWKPYRREMALPYLMRSWARRDLPAARAAVATIEPVELRESAAEAVVLGWYDSGDPAMWDAYVAGLPFGIDAAPELVRRFGAREGVEALLVRVAAVPEEAGDRFRGVTLRRAVEIAAEADLERAAEFAEAHRESAGGLERLVATRWGERDGARAMEWAGSHPPGRSRDRTLRGAFEGWLRSDEQAAFEWAARQQGEVRAAVLVPYADALARYDMQRALEISAGIPDARERQRVQRRLAQRWLAREPQVAASWLEENEPDLFAGPARPRRRGPASGPTAEPSGGGKDG